MGFLVLSKEYPSPALRQEFFQVVGPQFMNLTASLYQPLPASATTEEWRIVVRILKEQQQGEENLLVSNISADCIFPHAQLSLA